MRINSPVNPVLVTIILTFFPVLLLVMATQVSGDWTGKEGLEWQQGHFQRSSQFYFSDIPANPNVFESIATYKDAELTQKSQALAPNFTDTITNLKTNKKGVPVFKFSNGRYAEANYKQFYNDQLLSQQVFSQSKAYWTKDKFTVYKKAFVAGVATKKTKLSAYKEVTVTKKARTYHGNYLYARGQGWFPENSLSSEDNRIEAVQAMLEKKYKTPKKFSVYVKQMDTGKVAELNADKVMYSASVSKLPLLYYSQKQIDDHRLKKSQKVIYKPAVNKFRGAYATEGSGDISKVADNKPYTIETLMKKVAQKSDNAGTNILGYYATDQYGSDYRATIKKIVEQDWDMKSRKVSAKTAGLMMAAIYRQDGDIIDYLSNTDYDKQRISKNISVRVAHKIGDAYDYRHDVAIIYGKSPFVLAIFTNHSSYDDITAIADDVYRILK